MNTIARTEEDGIAGGPLPRQGTPGPVQRAANRGVAALLDRSAATSGGLVEQGADAVKKPEPTAAIGDHAPALGKGILAGSGFAVVDLTGANESQARANAIRQSQIDAQPGTRGILADIGKIEREALFDKWDRDNKERQLSNMDPRKAAAVANLIGANVQADTTRRSQDVQQDELESRRADTQARLGIMARGQDLRHDAAIRGQDTEAQTAAVKIESSERIAERRIDDRANRPAPGLTLPQVRSNLEIDAARKQIAGMTSDEITKRTQQFSATGRENPSYDPTLAKAVTLAGRRMYGDDPEFDQRQQGLTQPQAGSDDVANRFNADSAMKGRRLGKRADRGMEVFDASGQLIGYYN